MGPTSFNVGDAKELQWLNVHHGRFNGADVFQRRRRHILMLGEGSSDQLQWGRRLSTSETLRYVAPSRTICRFNGADVFQRRRHPVLSHYSDPVRELQWGRRLSTSETGDGRSEDTRTHSFNGADVFQRRRPDL